MAEFTGRILPLLWRRSIPARKAAGRPPRLSVDLVVTTGIRVADAEGLEAASMARVAAELAVGTMTLYTYVPSRDDLVELMVDEVLTERGLTGNAVAANDTGGGAEGSGAEEGGWRERVHLYADRTFAMYRAHPWLARVSQIRPPIGPGMLAEREFMLATALAAGLPTDRVNAAALAISGYVTAAARQEAESRLLSRATGMTTDDWWGQRGELWENWFDVEAHPAMTALWNAGAFDRGADEQARDAYEIGLALLLDGIARSVE